jgi:hypothetical protein
VASAPTISVIVPTIGRPTLARTLASIRDQADAREVEIDVVADTHRGTHVAALADVAWMPAHYDAVYVEHDGGRHDWGHSQRQYGQQVATGRWLMWTQDDDVYRPGAFATIRDVLQTADGPCLLRLQGWQAGLVWKRPALVWGEIDAGCLAVPNAPDRLPTWGTAYDADYDYIAAVCERWRRAEWVDAVIAEGRPHG